MIQNTASAKLQVHGIAVAVNRPRVKRVHVRKRVGERAAVVQHALLPSLVRLQLIAREQTRVQRSA